VRQNYFPIVGYINEADEEISIIEAGNGYDIRKNVVKGVVCRLEGLTPYSCWYYQDLIMASDAHAVIKQTEVVFSDEMESMETACHVSGGMGTSPGGTGFFDFEFKWPKIKMPRFSISPSGWRIGDLLDGVIPKLSIDWYAKAMKDPMLMTDPTIFGYNARTGSLMGGGEAGAEVVSGADTLMNMIGAAVEDKTNAQTGQIVTVLEVVIRIMQEMLSALLAGQKIMLNERELGRTVRDLA
jgi:hypothetical protein